MPSQLESTLILALLALLRLLLGSDFARAGVKTEITPVGGLGNSTKNKKPKRSKKPKKAKQPKSAIQCYSCLEMGHYARECPDRLGVRQDNCTVSTESSAQAASSISPNDDSTLIEPRSQTEIPCFRCSKIGHLPDDCPEWPSFQHCNSVTPSTTSALAVVPIAKTTSDATPDSTLPMNQ